MRHIFIFLMFSFSETKEQELGSFKEALKATDIQYKEIVLKQAILETGWFTSSIYKENKNAFGFFYKGEFKGFNSLEHCLKYYEDWQCKHYKGGDYYDFLECLYETPKGDCIRYAEDEDYISKLKKIEINL